MFGRRKMYKKGLADAMRAYEAFGKKQEAAIAHMREEIRKGQKLEEALNDTIASLGDDIAGLYNYLNSQEKKALYHLSTPLDIKDLDKEEQQFLLAILYQLASDEGDLLTDHQRMFIRSIQRYLEITNPQTEADLSAVGDIDSLEVQKAFLQTVLEFFYLQDGDELSEAQEEFLSGFSVNKRQAILIEERVSRLFNIVKADGIAEKYGYVPEDPQGAENSAQDKSTSNTSQAEHQYASNYIVPSQQIFQSLFDESIVPRWNQTTGRCIETESYYVIQGAYYPETQLIVVDKSTGKVVRECNFSSSCSIQKMNGIDDVIIVFRDYSETASRKGRKGGILNLKTDEVQDIDPKKGDFYLLCSNWPYVVFQYLNDTDLYVYNIETAKIKNIHVPFGYTVFVTRDEDGYATIEDGILYCSALYMPKMSYSGEHRKLMLMGYDLQNNSVKVQIPFQLPEYFEIQGFFKREDNICICTTNGLDGSRFSYHYHPERETVLVIEIDLKTQRYDRVFAESTALETPALVAGKQWFVYSTPGTEGDNYLVGIKLYNCITGERMMLAPGNVRLDGIQAFFFMSGMLFFKDGSGRPCVINLDRPGEVNVLG